MLSGLQIAAPFIAIGVAFIAYYLIKRSGKKDEQMDNLKAINDVLQEQRDNDVTGSADVRRVHEERSKR